SATITRTQVYARYASAAHPHGRGGSLPTTIERVAGDADPRPRGRLSLPRRRRAAGADEGRADDLRALAAGIHGLLLVSSHAVAALGVGAGVELDDDDVGGGPRGRHLTAGLAAEHQPSPRSACTARMVSRSIGWLS